MNLIARNSFRLRALPHRLSSLTFLRHQATCATTAIPSFPCVDAHAARESKILASSTYRYSQTGTRASSSDSGPEPPYARPNPLSYNTYRHQYPLELTYGSTLPSFDIAYETWGTLSPSRDNVILLHTGLSASSHAASTELNPTEGWWEKFIGPGRALDTNQFFVICTNVLGGCYGSTGPSSLDPEGQRYATRFPILSIFDMVRAQFKLLDHLGVQKLYASVGSSMGGMQSLAAGWLFPDRVGKIVSISGTARSSPGSIAMRHAQRSVLMADPHWNNGFYYDDLPPHTGMKLARLVGRAEIATITYRSGPEWDQRFGRKLRKLKDGESPSPLRSPTLCPDFLIETYLDHQGEQFCLKYDANSLLYISKAMDLFDLTLPALRELAMTTATHAQPSPSTSSSRQSTVPSKSHPPPLHYAPHFPELAAGLEPLKSMPILVLGVQSDILFPVEQQRELVDALRMAGSTQVSYFELGGVWGHDTFL
ncbi:homoserine acetyltransferase [Suillus subalutaceus]|uniref:homoserine acetyltransferase n=1 Tax=Suillus subalutaceus TaxID=48586 RepID=UPI001B85EC6F|nr:homoserine acetyltransferase [Suillus subalutaceus]KAG1846769.1 homoserine acetyltransferase [Suillus subalutaceus]